MIHVLKIVQTKFLSIGIILINICFLIPNLIECLMWKSGVTLGYAAIELVFIYIGMIFFFVAIISLIDVINANYRIHALIITMFLYLISFIFAFRIISYIMFIFLLQYSILFLILFKQTRTVKKYNFKIINIIGLIVTLIWTIIDFKFLR